MAIAVQTVAEKVKPLEGAIVRRGTLGATTTAGQPVTLQSDGKWDPTDTSTAQVTVRIAVQGGADGEVVDMVVHGPVSSITGGTPGLLVFGSDTAGEVSETAGTKDTVIGYNESATVLFVQPQIVDLS